MKRLHKQTSFLLLGILLLILCTACQGGVEANSNTQEGTTSVSNEQAKQMVLAEEQGNTSQKGETAEPVTLEKDKKENEAEENRQKYVVNPHNYLIQPVEHEDNRVILLTFDDTPTAKATMDILDTLDKHEAKAIFFVNGHYAEPNVDTLKEIAERGHYIGNHTWWHKSLRQEEPETVREEIVALNDFIEAHLGERPKYFRPPFGQNSDVSRKIIAEEGMQTMNWSNGSLDWELKSTEAIIKQVISNLKPGDNILFHDKQITAEALDEILTQITEQGYRFVLPTEVIVSSE